MAKILTPLANNVPIVDEDGNPTPYFQRVMQELTDARVSASLIDALGGDPGANEVVIWDDITNDLTFASISEVLDIISSAHGSIIYRDTGSWQALAPGTAGQILQTNGAGADPSWITPSSVPTLYEAGPPTPPTTSDFATWMNQDASTVSDGTGAMILKAGLDGVVHGREKATPSAPFNVYCRVNVDMLSTAANTSAINNNAGILLRDSSDGELIACTLWQERVAGDEQNLYGVSLDRWTASGDIFSARPILKYNNIPWKWIRVNVTSTTITLYVSQDGKNWISVGTETIATFIDTVDRYGPCVLASANATEAVAAFSYFSTTAPS